MIRSFAYPWTACVLALALLATSSSAQGSSPLGDWVLSQDSVSSTPHSIPAVDPRNWTHYEEGRLSGVPIPKETSHEARSLPNDDFQTVVYQAYAPQPGSRDDWLAARWDDALLSLEKIQRDFYHQYTGRNLRALGLTLAIAAPLANTRADENFHRWYQSHVRSRRTDEWSKVGNRLGQHWITVPVFVGAAATGAMFEDSEAAQWAGDWGKRSIRALMVGSPTVGVLQYGLGAGRPGEYENSSRWRPFQDKNSVAGHGFVGAVPFLTAASMTENRPLKALFFVGSFWTCWARVNGESHYLSQSILGWTIAYLAVESVSATEAEHRRWQLVPLEMPEGGSGVGIVIRY